MYISSLTSNLCNLVFDGEFYLRFISFDIKVSHHVKYGIGHNSSSMGLNELRFCGRAMEEVTYMPN